MAMVAWNTLADRTNGVGLKADLQGWNGVGLKADPRGWGDVGLKADPRGYAVGRASARQRRMLISL